MIGVWSYEKEYQQYSDDILKIVDKVFKSNRLILGKFGESFENNMAQYLNTGFGVGVNSGTDALFLALKTLGIKDGDEVITVSNTAVPTVSAIVSAGAKPVFVDINESDFLMNIERVEAVITKKTKVILPVHLYGQCVDMDNLNLIAKKYNLSVLEDCAQSTGATYKNKQSGVLGDISAFSFYPTKILGGYGDGGMIFCKDKTTQKNLKSLRMYGMEGVYNSNQHGYNSRLDEVQAGILDYKLRLLDTWVKRRREIAHIYNKLLEDTGLILPIENEDNYHAYYLYVVRHKNRDEIIKKLKEKRIFLNVSYPYPIHTMKAYQNFGYKQGDFPITERLSTEIFSLPMYPNLTNKEVDFICQTIKDIL